MKIENKSILNLNINYIFFELMNKVLVTTRDYRGDEKQIKEIAAQLFEQAKQEVLSASTTVLRKNPYL